MKGGRVLLGLVSVLAAAATACSLLLNLSDTQCSTDADCRKLSASAVCTNNICQLPAETGGGDDGPVAEGGEAQGSDAGAEACTQGPPGCFTGTPSSDPDFYNQCTCSQYMAFDNCARIGLCDGAAPPMPMPPPTPDAGSSDAGVTLPTVNCYDPMQRKKPIFVQGSTNFTPFIKQLATIITDYTIVWQPTSSCTGAGAGGFATAPGNYMSNPTSPSQSPASFYDSNGNGTPCLLGTSAPPSIRN
jgi:hypothetical protein